jgi:hypothetical protein
LQPHTTWQSIPVHDQDKTFQAAVLNHFPFPVPAEVIASAQKNIVMNIW